MIEANVDTKIIRYSDAELQEFKLIILEKLKPINFTLKHYRESLESTNQNSGNDSVLDQGERGSNQSEKEYLKSEIKKYEKQEVNLNNALVRIDQKTYGICKNTEKLICKERLKIQPQTEHSIPKTS